MEQTDLSFFCKTKAQATDFSSRLSKITAMIYKTGFNLDKVLMDEFGLQKKDKFMALLRDAQVQSSSQSALKNFLEGLQEKTSTLPVLSLTLAFEPKEITLKVISDWFLLNVKKQVLLDIVVDTDLIAGAAITYNGKFKDFTIKEVFHKVLADTIAESSVKIPEQNGAQKQPTDSSPEHLHLGR